jgi:hypothetical protein
MSRTLSFVAALFAVAISGANGADLSLIGSSAKVCQLTGEQDWASNTPTAAQTLSNFGMDGTDLGFPVEAGNRLYLLFGDTWPINHPAGSFPSVPPDDALGWTTRTTTPDANTCLDLQIASTRHVVRPPTVQPVIKQGLFDVPAGGIFHDGALYAFFWTDHCATPNPLSPNATAPLMRPAANTKCIEIPQLNSVGRSVLAKALPANPTAFSQIAYSAISRTSLMPSGFVYVTAVHAVGRSVEKIEAVRKPKAVMVFGAPRYRASIPYLAMAPGDTFDSPATWKFYSGTADGHPVWISREQWESGHTADGAWTPPAGAEIFTAGSDSERCIGEHQVTWNTTLETWLLLYNCGGKIEARWAPEPWGPWSDPITLLSRAHDPWVNCELVMSAAGCPGMVRRNYWPGVSATVPGGFYAPFILSRFTQPLKAIEGKRRAAIYWTVSTWNPYNVVVMRSVLETGIGSLKPVRIDH